MKFELETERLNIRKYKKEDGRDFFDLLERKENRQYLKDHVDEATTITSLEETKTRIEEFISYWDKKERYILGIWLKTSGTYIGQLWIEPNKKEVPSFELGWFLDRLYQGQGLATEAVKKAIGFLFDELKAHKIIVLVLENNERSNKLAKRCGFVKEGLLRDHTVRNGKRIGLNYYGLLKTEYKTD